MSKQIQIYQASRFEYWVSYLDELGGRRYDTEMNLSESEAVKLANRRHWFTKYPIVRASSAGIYS